MEEAKAETVVKFGPLKLYLIEICPTGISEISLGMKNGLNLGIPLLFQNLVTH